jgi:transglutaminase-like putative cysteine protease
MNRNWGTLTLAILASLSILLLRLQGSTTPAWVIIETFACIVLSLMIRLWLNRQPSSWLESKSSGRFRSVFFSAGVLVVLVPWVSKLIQTRALGGNGEATELVWMGMLQYAALWIAAGATQARHEWLSFLMSCFLTIFGLATSDREGMIQIVGPFAIIAAWWLMARYWSSIEGGFVASENIPLVRMRMMILIGLAGMAGVALWLATSVSRETVLLDGFMPTSGGKQRADASARQGVGDGDMLVAARDEAFTFGAVDTDLFLESEVPSMYDLVSEIYGEASNKKRKYARAISLDQQVQEMEREGTESKKNSREFSALRKPKDPNQSLRPEGTESRAVVQLIGRTPAWLRSESFDRFENGTWYQSPTLDLTKRNMEPELKVIQDKPWMTVQSISSELAYPVRERLALKVIGLESPRLLSPSWITHIHIDRVDQPDFFGWTQDGQLMMPNRDTVPRLTVVHQLTQIPSLHVLRDPQHPMCQLSHAPAAHGSSNDFLSHYLQIDASEKDAVQCARSWLEEQRLADEPATDWERVSAIIARLRSKIALDPSALPPEDCDDVISYVLEKGRGPDYLIATTAVMMIRNLGIPCRLCRGFFARPDRFDYRSGQTEVLPEDLHTWAEVYAHGAWIPVEPTGAFPIPMEHRTWQQWVIQSAWWMRDAVVRHPWRTVAVLGTIGFLLFVRQRILELVLSCLSIGLQWLPTKLRIRWMLRTLRWRMWLWNEPVPPYATLQRWLTEQLTLRSSASPSDLESFVRTVQRVAYAPPAIHQKTLSASARVIDRVCWSMVLSGVRHAIAIRSLPSKQ